MGFNLQRYLEQLLRPPVLTPAPPEAPPPSSSPGAPGTDYGMPLIGPNQLPGGPNILPTGRVPATPWRVPTGTRNAPVRPPYRAGRYGRQMGDQQALGSSPAQSPNYAIPSGNMSLADRINAARNTGPIASPSILKAEAARAIADANAERFQRNGPGGQSTDMDPDLRDLADIEAEIRAIAGQPDIPGQWISPYSQAYLNSLGDRLGQAGSEAQAQFQAAIGDITQNYGSMTDARNSANTALVNELGGNAGNIGVNYAASQQGQQAATDADYLNQTAATNQATDTSFMTKLGEMAQFYGGNLAAQAREGLLTPKQWQGPQSGISAGESALLDFLQGKYNRELDEQDMARELAAAGSDSDLAGVPKITQTADEDMKQLYPDVPNAIMNYGKPGLRELLGEVWDESGGDPAVALQKIRDRQESYPGSIGIPPTGIMPRGASTTQGGGLNYADVQRHEREMEMAKYAEMIEFFRKLSPTWTGVTTSRSLSDSSKATY